jgi:hypothetical protein
MTFSGLSGRESWAMSLLQTIATEPLLIMNTANSSKAIDFNVCFRNKVNIKQPDFDD